MQANPQNKQGSFGLPKGMQEAINAKEQAKIDEEVKRGPAGTPAPVMEAESASGPNADEITKTEKARMEEETLKQSIKMKLAIEKAEERLGIQIVQQDLIDMVRKGRVVKNPVTIIKGFLTVGFQTLTGEDVQAIEEHMYKVRLKGDMTSQAIENEEVFWKLAYGIVSWQTKDTSAVKDKDKIREQLLKQGASVLDKTNRAYIDFKDLIDLKMGDPDFIKK